MPPTTNPPLPIRLLGVASYAAVVTSLLYFLAFLTGFVGAHDDGGNPVAAVAIDLGLVALFGASHSVMARASFKRAWTRVIPAAAERSVYVLVASALLALLCWSWRPLPGPTLWSASGVAATVLMTGQVLGFGIALLSSFLIDHYELFGLRQAFGRDAGPRQFRTPLLYRVVRHPLYLGLVITLWLSPRMDLGRVVLAAALTLYVAIGARLEERDLVRTFGDDYRRYQREVPMILPH